MHAVAPLLLDLAADLTALVEEDEQAFVHVDLERGARAALPRARACASRRSACAPARRCRGRAYALAVDEVPAGRGQLPDGALFVLGNAADLKAGRHRGGACAGRPGPRARGGDGGPHSLHQKGLQTRCEAGSCSSTTSRAAEASAPLRSSASRRFRPRSPPSRRSRPALVKEALAQGAAAAVDRRAQEAAPRAGQHSQPARHSRRARLARRPRATRRSSPSSAGWRWRGRLSHQFSNSGPLFAWLVDPGGGGDAAAAGGQAIDPSDAARSSRASSGSRGRARPCCSRRLTCGGILRRLMEGAFPDVAVLTFSELDPELQVRRSVDWSRSRRERTRRSPSSERGSEGSDFGAQLWPD